MDKSIIECKALTLGYNSEEVINELTFSVKDGEYLSVIGGNGVGKSTLMKALLGLLEPLQGKIEYIGIKASEIGYMPQLNDIQREFPASVYEIVLSGRLGKKRLLPIYNKSDKKAAEAAMEKLGISEIKNKCYNELSGGQGQRVLLARALVAAEKLLLLDEPATGLDHEATVKLYSLIEKLNKEDGMTIITVTHDLNSALKYSDRILNIKKKSWSIETPEDFGKREGDKE